jgi:hypothetical protein
VSRRVIGPRPWPAAGRSARRPGRPPGERAERHGFDEILDLGVHALRDENLAVARLLAEPGAQICDGADRRVVESAFVADAPDGGVAHVNAGAEAECEAAAAPLVEQPLDAVAHGDRHLHRARRRVGTGDGIVEEHHEPVAGEPLERTLVAGDESPDRRVIVAQQAHHVFGIGFLGESGEAAKIAEEHGDLPPVRSEHRLVAGRQELGELRREEPFQALRALQLGAYSLAIAQPRDHGVERRA